MKKQIRRLLILTLAAVMALSSLAACGKKKKEETSAGAQQSAQAPGGASAQASSDEMKNYVYRVEDLPVTEEMEETSIDFIQYVDGRIYAAGAGYGESPVLRVFSFAEDGSDLQTKEYPLAETDSVGHVAFDEEGNVYMLRIEYAWEPYEEDVPADGELPEDAAGSGVIGGADGPTQILVTEASDEAQTEEILAEETQEASAGEAPEAAEEVYVANSDETTVYLTAYGPDGAQKYDVKLEAEEGEEGYYWVSNFVCADGGLVASNYDTLRVYNPADGSLVKKVKMKEGSSIDRVVVTKDGTVVAGGYTWNQAAGEGSMEFKKLNMKDGSFGEEVQLPGNAWRYNYFTGTDYDLILTDEIGIYGANLGGGEPEKLMDAIASDIAEPNFYRLCSISRDRFVTIGWDEESGQQKISFYTKVDPSQVKDKVVLTMATSYIGWRTKRAVVNFNKTNDTYRININDYSRFNTDTDYEAGMTRLNADLASGNIPDLLELSEDMPIQSYMAKGLFEDLTPYFKDDAELSANQYLTNVLDAYNRGGSMYQIIPSFTVRTLIGKTSDFGPEPGLTVDRLETLQRERNIDYKYLTGLTTRDWMLYMMLIFGNDSYVDWESGRCSYDSPEFISLLEFIRKFPAELTEEDYNEDTYSFFRSGRSLIESAYLSSFNDYMMERYGTFGTDITMVGYPNGGAKDFSGSMINANRRYAMSSTSVNQEGAWQFLRTFLTKDYQDQIPEQEGAFPVLMSTLEKMAQDAQKKPTYKDENGADVEYNQTWWVDGQEIEIPPMTRDEADRFISYLKSLTATSSYDVNIMNIIQEEVTPVFEGQKPASEAARIIQSRVGVYINENS
ncbi:MAG: extracellular solute-binding protein [Lachnospiraceae bacterium]|nr:extracellular solute-binding protein [Lachnospiraceae bacterium]